jgi:hypothetical protein
MIVKKPEIRYFHQFLADGHFTDRAGSYKYD